MNRLNDEAAAHVEATLRRESIQALGWFVRDVSLSSQTEIDRALVACELSVALAGRAAPALDSYPGLVDWVQEWRQRWPSFGGAQLSQPHWIAKWLRREPSALRAQAVAEAREAQLDAELDDLIHRLDPAPPEPLRWWQQTGPITLTIATGITPTDAAMRLDADADAGRPTRFWDVWDGHDYDAIHLAVQIDELQDHTILIEPNGWLMTVPRRAERMSQGASLVSVYWNKNALMRLTLATNGTIIRSFDPVLYEQPSIGERLPQESDLRFDAGHSLASTITLQERLTGVQVTADWILEQPHPTWWGIPM